MSEQGHQATDILLPSATVAVYSKDAETLKSAGQTGQDWRFARVTLRAEEGDVDSAIQGCKDSGSPDLIIIQTDTIDDGFTKKLEDLSNYCSSDTAAIIIGPVNDVYLYRRLIGMGISDYLVKPVTPEILSGVIAKTLIHRLGVSGSHLVAFLGTKGGVGVSSIAQAMAWGVSEFYGQKTVLVDGAGGWSSLGVGMGFDPVTTLAEVARAVSNNDEDGLNRMFFEASPKLSVLSGGGDVMLEDPASPEQYELFIDRLMVKAPVVMVDLSGSEAELKKLVVSRANQIILVTMPTLTALRCARTLLKEITDLRGGKASQISLVVNKQGISKAHEVSSKDIQQALDFAPSAFVPFLTDLFLGHESEAKQILSNKDGERILRSSLLPLIKDIIASGTEEDSKDSKGKKASFIEGILPKFKSK